FRVLDEPSERVGKCLDVSRRNKNSGTLLDDLHCTTDTRGDYRQAGLERFDEDNAKPLRPEIRMAKNVGGGHQTRNVGALPQKPDAIENAQFTRLLLKTREVLAFLFLLNTACDPANPIGQFPHLGQGTKE